MPDADVNADRFQDQLAELQRRVDRLRERAADLPSQLLGDAMAELSVTVEELRVAEEELRQQSDELQEVSAAAELDRRRYLDLFNLAPDGYLVTNAAGLIEQANVAAAALLDLPADYLVGKPLAVFVPPESTVDFRKRLGQIGKLQRARTWEGRLRRRDQSPVEVEFTVAPARELPNGKLVELRWRIHNIETRKAAEQTLPQSRQMLRELSARLQTVREEERTRIAREVHDELGGALTAIKMDLGQIKHRLAAGDVDSVLARAEAASRMVDSTMDTVRRIAADLRPALLDELGLVAAVDWRLQEFQKRTGIVATLHVTAGELACPPQVGTVAFRVFEELLTNVARHAQAHQVDVRLAQPAGSLRLEVRDDGRGITEAEANRVTSLGLMGMHERLQQIGGDLELQGVPREGTTAVVTVPLVPSR